VFRRLQWLFATRPWVAAGAVIAVIASVRLSHGQGTRSTPFVENQLQEITRDDLVGEWSGLTAEQDVFVSVRVGHSGRDAVLAVARRTGDAIATRAHRLAVAQTREGAFSIGGPADPVRLEATAQVRLWGAATGRGTLVLRDGERERRRELYLFRLRDRSWAEQMLTLARKYGLL
jgi:hypothetical protein